MDRLILLLRLLLCNNMNKKAMLSQGNRAMQRVFAYTSNNSLIVIVLH